VLFTYFVPSGYFSNLLLIGGKQETFRGPAEAEIALTHKNATMVLIADSATYNRFTFRAKDTGNISYMILPTPEFADKISFEVAQQILYLSITSKHTFCSLSAFIHDGNFRV